MPFFRYDKVSKEIAPKRVALKKAEAIYEEKMEGLKVKQGELEDLMAKLSVLERKVAEAEARKRALERDVEQVRTKLDRAERLIGGLREEQVRWAASNDELVASLPNLVGDCLLSSAAISYLGALTHEHRQKALGKWAEECMLRSIPVTPRFLLSESLGDPMTIRAWEIAGLPNDPYSVDSGVLCYSSRRFPLIIDPQKQASRWIRNMERGNNLRVVRASEPGLMRQLESAVSFGLPMLVEEVGEDLDPALDPLLQHRTLDHGGGMNVVRLGETAIEMHESFRLFLTCNLRNPHYLPDVWSKVTIINFTVTQPGLAEQLLAVVVKRERPELEEQRTGLIQSMSDFAQQLKGIEDEILRVLSESKGNILEDESAIRIISEAQTLSNEIKDKRRISEQTAAAIEQARNLYRPSGQMASTLYSCVLDLGTLDPMYQYSLAWFTGLFEASMNLKPYEEAHDLETRLKGIESRFLRSTYEQVSQSLFRKDKILLSMLMAMRLQLLRGQITQSEVDCFVMGAAFRTQTELDVGSQLNSARDEVKRQPLATQGSVGLARSVSFEPPPRALSNRLSMPVSEKIDEGADEGQDEDTTVSAEPSYMSGTLSRRSSMQSRNRRSGVEMRPLIKSSTQMMLLNPPPGDWPPPVVWEELVMVSEADDALASLPLEVRRNTAAWRSYAEHPQMETLQPPAPFICPAMTEVARGAEHESAAAQAKADAETGDRLPNETSTLSRMESQGSLVPLTLFQHLMIVRTLRKDRLISAMRIFVRQTLGRPFTEAPPPDVNRILFENDYMTPILFILTPGVDPAQILYHLAIEHHMQNRMAIVSLGQGQGERAEKAIQQEMKDGGWVLLQASKHGPGTLWLWKYITQPPTPCRAELPSGRELAAAAGEDCRRHEPRARQQHFPPVAVLPAHARLPAVCPREVDQDHLGGAAGAAGIAAPVAGRGADLRPELLRPVDAPERAQAAPLLAVLRARIRAGARQLWADRLEHPLPVLGR